MALIEPESPLSRLAFCPWTLTCCLLISFWTAFVGMGMGLAAVSEAAPQIVVPLLVATQHLVDDS